MVQGRKMGEIAIVETVRVEAIAIQQELIEAHGSAAQKEIHRRHLQVASELEKRNVFEDGVHAGMFAEVLAG